MKCFCPTTRGRQLAPSCAWTPGPAAPRLVQVVLLGTLPGIPGCFCFCFFNHYTLLKEKVVSEKTNKSKSQKETQVSQNIHTELATLTSSPLWSELGFCPSPHLTSPPTPPHATTSFRATLPKCFLVKTFIMFVYASLCIFKRCTNY